MDVNMKIEMNPYAEENNKNNMSFDQAYRPMNLQTIDVSNKANQRYGDQEASGFNSERITPRRVKPIKAPQLYKYQDKYSSQK